MTFHGSVERSATRLEAAVLDLDGVITRTARVHRAAWKAMFDPYLASRGDVRPFSDEDYRTDVDGKPRYDGVASFLASRGIELPWGDPGDAPEAETVCGLGNRKQRLFHERLAADGVEVYEDGLDLVRRLRAAGARIAVASSSRNALAVLRRAGIESLFDARVDGVAAAERGLAGKPRPDLFLAAAAALGAAPERSLVVEDAVAGVEAGRAGGFGLVVGVARGGGRDGLRAAGADLVVESLASVRLETIERWITGRAEVKPSALAAFGEIAARLAGRRPAVFLDYDGTLTPIVARPELAVLSASMREALRRLARAAPTFIVSGRGLDDVRSLAGLPELYYAGSHGFEIVGPEGSGLRHEVEPKLREEVARAEAALAPRVAAIPGALVENKRFSLAVHYRLAQEADVPRLEALAREAVAASPGLRLAPAKKVFELRPRLEWDKGKALLWLLRQAGLGEGALPFYVGDDTTDEDAFAVLDERGVGVLTADAPRPTRARYRVQDTEEVRELLARLAALAGGGA